LSEAAALASKEAAEDAEEETEALLAEFQGIYYGTLAGDPIVRPSGDPMESGDLYFDSVTSRLRIYDGATWGPTTGDIPTHVGEADPHSQYQMDFTITTAQTGELSSYDAWLADTSVSGPTRNLPSAPADGDEVKVVDDSSNAAINNITIGRNGNTIMGLSEDLEIDKAGAVVILKYIDADGDWRLV